MNPAAFQNFFDLSGKNAVVTGGASGIGEAISTGFLEAGADVLIADLVKENNMPLEKLRKKFSKKAVWGHQVNVTKRKEVNELKQFAIEKMGQIDILVNNAGIVTRKDAIDLTEKEWSRVIDVNLNGVFNCSQIIGKHMVEKEGGKIINMASLAGILGSKRNTPYCASKGGVIQITKSLALEWARNGVRVNAIAPHYIKNGMTREEWENEQKRRDIKSSIPLNRLGEPSDVVGASIFLASPASDWITGHTLVLDGGVMVKGS